MPFIIAAVIVLLFLSCIRIVSESNLYIIEFLGKYKRVMKAGIHLKIPILEKIAKKISLKEQVIDFPPQSVITKDNVSMQIDTVIYYRVSNPELYTYGVANPIFAIENLTATTVRNIIGELELDDTLTSRDVINSKMCDVLDRATDAWGIKITRVELKNIIPPHEIQVAMEKQMKAERERREKILQAEGEKKSAILVAEGEKQAQILRAEAEKQTEILKAEADKEANILRAEGEAAAIDAVQTALAESLVKLNQSNPSQGVIALKSLEAFAKAADGKATKIIIPSEIQSLAGLATSAKVLLEDK